MPICCVKYLRIRRQIYQGPTVFDFNINDPVQSRSDVKAIQIQEVKKTHIQHSGAYYSRGESPDGEAFLNIQLKSSTSRLNRTIDWKKRYFQDPKVSSGGKETRTFVLKMLWS